MLLFSVQKGASRQTIYFKQLNLRFANFRKFIDRTCTTFNKQIVELTAQEHKD